MYFLDRINIDVVRHRRKWFFLSGTLIILSIILLATRGLNLGIDFTGGTLLQRTFTESVTEGEIREALAKEPLAQLDLAKSAKIQKSGDNRVFIRTDYLSPDEERQLDAGLEQLVAPLDRGKSSTDTVGAVIGKELYTKAFWSVVLASLFILVYVTFRFEFKFGVAAVVALIHDVLITLGVFALLGREVNSPFVAAMLTIVGYSINDTIIIFDRIRENLRFRKKETVGEIVNKSINETLSRSINTVLTTLVTMVALYFFGGATIKTFSLALIIGISLGAYSSIFVAGTIWVSWKMWEQKRAHHQSA
ncbi:MAG: protein translocase subunit SecF [Firmicutes bacterium]|nr:protein translocase subunit SecF [Bacillota bacterium]